MPWRCAASSAPAISSRRRAQRARAAARPVAELGAKRDAAHQLARDEQLAVDLLERVDRGDRRMRRAPPPRVPRAPVVRGRWARGVYAGRQRLERDGASEPRVLGRIDDAHAAASDFFLNRVRADLATGLVGGAVESVAEERRGRPPRPAFRGTHRTCRALRSSARTSDGATGPFGGLRAAAARGRPRRDRAPLRRAP